VNDRIIKFDYTNWRGERRTRTVWPKSIWFGSTEHHAELQWFLNAQDMESNETRDFALRDIHGFIREQTDEE
jgi:predicted DNA-binding transcriptional regulator YafY